MNKAELIKWLTEEEQKWALLLVAIGETRLAQPGVNGAWSMRDIIAHLAGWQQWLVIRLHAAATGQPEPTPPWPVDLKAEDAINEWIYTTNCNRSVREVLDEAHALHEQLLAIIQALPGDAQIEVIEAKFPVIWVGGQRFAVGEFFHHFYDDHAADVHAWLVEHHA